MPRRLNEEDHTMLDHDIISTIRSSETQTDEHLRCVTSALMVGTRVCPREPLLEPDCPSCATERDDGDCCCTESCPIGGTGLPEPLPAATPLHRALLDAIANSTTWRD